MTQPLHGEWHDASRRRRSGRACFVAALRRGREIVDVSEHSTEADAQSWLERELAVRGYPRGHVRCTTTASRDPKRDPRAGDVIEDGWIYTVVERQPRQGGKGSLVRYTKHLAGETRRDEFRTSLGGWRSRWGTLR